MNEKQIEALAQVLKTISQFSGHERDQLIFAIKNTIDGNPRP